MQIIQHHLDDLAKGRYTKISQSTGTSLQQVLRARDAILGLEPKPGAAFSGGHVTFIVPDVAVRRLGDEFVVILNDSALLAIRWNPYYRKLLAAGEQDARNYLIKQMRRARFLLRSIEQRRLTISRVMEAIVERQRRFFMEGPGHLEPMTLKDIASRLDMHDSTVSRAVAGKYVDTPFGVFPCKMFFTPGVESRGQEVSQYNIKKLYRTNGPQRRSWQPAHRQPNRPCPKPAGNRHCKAHGCQISLSIGDSSLKSQEEIINLAPDCLRMQDLQTGLVI